jgi:hypothetical protein
MNVSGVGQESASNQFADLIWTALQIETW